MVYDFFPTLKINFRLAVGGVLENFPANFKVPLNHIQQLVDRRRPGQSSITTPRKETDKIQILSGILDWCFFML